LHGGGCEFDYLEYPSEMHCLLGNPEPRGVTGGAERYLLQRRCNAATFGSARSAKPELDETITYCQLANFEAMGELRCRIVLSVGFVY